MVLWVVTGRDAYNGGEYRPLVEGGGKGGREDDAGDRRWVSYVEEKIIVEGISLYQSSQCMKVGDIFANKKLVRQMQERPRTLMWVRGHQGVGRVQRELALPPGWEAV